MKNSATDVRGARRHEARARVTDTARRLTAELGLHGFTIEELCAEVGISRRSFFNYFPSKEKAIVGYPGDDEFVALEDRFIAARPAASVGISETLLADLTDLALAHLATIGHTREQARGFAAAIETEPQLLRSLLARGEEQELYMANLVARREGVSPDHPVVVMAVATIGMVMRTGCRQFYAPDNERSIDTIMRELVAATAVVFAPHIPTEPQSQGNE